MSWSDLAQMGLGEMIHHGLESGIEEIQLLSLQQLHKVNNQHDLQPEICKILLQCLAAKSTAVSQEVELLLNQVSAFCFFPEIHISPTSILLLTISALF